MAGELSSNRPMEKGVWVHTPDGVAILQSLDRATGNAVVHLVNEDGTTKLLVENNKPTRNKSVKISDLSLVLNYEDLPVSRRPA